jgi:aspartyl-tRNA(Asn)/glutamyl-tRNA(Gln) amidotransferase subunit A
MTEIDDLRAGRTSSAELTEHYLARIEALDGAVKSYVTVTPELARAQAAAADEARERGVSLGPLHGLPVAIKDNIATAGVRTTIGSAFYADHVPDEDATVAAKLREAGAVVLGKVALHEFAFGATTQNPHHGKCRNPWDLDRVPGGSSGGSGASVAAGLCAMALGTDTGGSVRIPSCLNGITGIRPTIGRVSNRHVYPVSWTFDTVGPMAHTVDVVARSLSVIAGYDHTDPLSVSRPSEDFTASLGQGVKGLRIGLPRTFYFEEADPEVVDGVRAAGEELAALGAEVFELDLPGAADALEAGATIIRGDAFAVHRDRLREQPERYGEDVRKRLLQCESVTGADYARAREQGRRWTRDVDTAFQSVDAILTPVAGTTAPIADQAEMIETTRRLTRFTYGFTLAGLPGLAVPCGLSTEGLPLGLQLVAAPWQEALLLRIGAAYQGATDWHTRRPSLAVAA